MHGGEMPILFTFALFSIFHAGTGGIDKVLGFLITLISQSRISRISCSKWMPETAYIEQFRARNVYYSKQF